MEKNKNRKKHIRISSLFFLLAAVGGIAGGLLFKEKIYPYLLTSRPAAVLHDIDDFGYIPMEESLKDLSVKAPQAFVYDCTAEKIIYRKGDDKVLYPASTTKLLTILCALDVLDPDTLVTPGDELSLVGPDSSLAYVKEEHTLSVGMLVEGMLVPSGNDAAYVLAAAAGKEISHGNVCGKEAVAVFLDAMGKYAEKLGLVGTKFTTPDGLAGQEHYTTVEDMILICRAAMENEIIMSYARLPADDVVYASGHSNHWDNTNRLLHETDPYYRREVTGLKTGSLIHNFCLVCTAEKDGKSYIIGVFSEWENADRFEDATKILDTLFAS